MKNKFFFVAALLYSLVASAHNNDSTPLKKTKTWFENITVRGYVQVRYNRLLETNKNLKCEQCDRSIGNNGGISIRRGRIILSGQINSNVFFTYNPILAAR